MSDMPKEIWVSPESYNAQYGNYTAYNRTINSNQIKYTRKDPDTITIPREVVENMKVDATSGLDRSFIDFREGVNTTLNQILNCGGNDE